MLSFFVFCATRIVKKKKSVAGQFAAVKYRSETYCWTQKLNREDYGIDKYLLAVSKE
jgi:hypothetical protein